ncbi:dihydrodipicolinate synthase [Balneicella halophila]|uniref:4-hydroxy-tetrahydrodipicolinate synthase n=1 Tax=Balneicella halophila TaxID=1537566 RepID=A0A7L4URS0_BALHA|nr:4-hydroxy-tetrahydrodipicolinate synthase [Balneicella halophila]PVX51019.1 dihydrodipicolinate synthase [Balneicella halophila]
MIKAKDLKGTGVAVVTPFTKNKEVDFDALKRIVNYLIDGGVDYLVALGTTAETATLTTEEQKAIADCVFKETAGRVPLVIGAGGNNTQAVINTIEQNEWIQQYDSLLIATPFYNKPNQEGLYQHYKAIVQSTSLPIVLYNVPGRTGVNMSAETSLKLANDFQNIIAIKEASGNLIQINRIINQKPNHFEVISGDDGLTLPMIAIGAIGVISVLANALPKEMSRLVNAALTGDYVQAQKMQKVLFEISQKIFAEGNPTGIKVLMEQKGLIKNGLRLPLLPASATLENELSRCFLDLES